ncbi:MAG TPA: hypothetical protein VFT64_08405 [Rickettsiales bacterium]|nr:hypothetical protein [Rickettsiales bacterium]
MTENENEAKVQTGATEDTKFFPPDYSLKKAIGEDVDLKKIFSEENITKAQATIEKHKESFLEWALTDTATMNKHFEDAMAKAPECEEDVSHLEQIAARIQSQAGTFGFDLATLVAKSLSSFCLLHGKPNAEQLVVIRKHIDTLSVIFAKNIMGDGGVVGQELLDNLFKMVEKYQ